MANNFLGLDFLETLINNALSNPAGVQGIIYGNEDIEQQQDINDGLLMPRLTTAQEDIDAGRVPLYYNNTGGQNSGQSANMPYTSQQYQDIIKPLVARLPTAQEDIDAGRVPFYYNNTGGQRIVQSAQAPYTSQQHQEIIKPLVARLPTAQEDIEAGRVPLYYNYWENIYTNLNANKEPVIEYQRNLPSEYNNLISRIALSGHLPNDEIQKLNDMAVKLSKQEDYRIKNYTAAQERDLFGLNPIATPNLGWEYKKYDDLINYALNVKGELSEQDSQKITDAINGLLFIAQSDPTKANEVSLYLDALYKIPRSGVLNRAESGAISVLTNILGGLIYSKDMAGQGISNEIENLRNQELQKAYAEYNYALSINDVDKIISTAEKIKSLRKNDAVSLNSDGSKLFEVSRQQNFNAKNKLDAIQSFGMDAGLSAVNYLVNLGLAVGNPALALGLMGIQSGTNQAYDVAKLGGNFDEQFLSGTATTAIEIATERLPLDNVIKILKSSKHSIINTILNIFKHSGIEATEETINYTLGTLINKAILGGKADDLNLMELLYRGALGLFSGMGISSSMSGLTVLPRASDLFEGIADAVVEEPTYAKKGYLPRAGEIAHPDDYNSSDVLGNVDQESSVGYNGSEVGETVYNLLDKSSCSIDDFYKYLNKINSTYADTYAKTGKWPSDVQIPKSPDVLKEDGSINWDKAPKGGYVLDGNGDAIKMPHIPGVGEIIDRHGSPDGRYVSPVINNKPYSYDMRSLPYVENSSNYNKYRVVGDFSKLEQYMKSCSNETLKKEIYEYIDIYYEGDFSKISVFQGKVSRVNGWGIGGAIQYELLLKIEWLESLGILKKILND